MYIYVLFKQGSLKTLHLFHTWVGYPGLSGRDAKWSMQIGRDFENCFYINLDQPYDTVYWSRSLKSNIEFVQKS